MKNLEEIVPFWLSLWRQQEKDFIEGNLSGVAQKILWRIKPDFVTVS
jgi:hypothetical protein